MKIGGCCVGLQMGLGAGGSYRLLQGGYVFYSQGVSVRLSQDCLACCVLVLHTLANTHTNGPPRALLRSEEKAEGVNVKIIHHWWVHLERGLWGWDFQHPPWEWFSPFLNTELAFFTFPPFPQPQGEIFHLSFFLSFSFFLSLHSPQSPMQQRKKAHISLSAPVQFHRSPPPPSPLLPLACISSLALGRKAVHLPRPLPSFLMPSFTGAVPR